MTTFDDLEIGQTLAGGHRLVERDEIIRFATLYDPQPFHTDDTAAQATFFNGLAASGWHTAAMTMRLLTEFGPHVAGGLIGGSVASFVVENLKPLAAIKYKLIGAIAGGAGGYLISLLIADLSFDSRSDLDHLIAFFACGASFGGF